MKWIIIIVLSLITLNFILLYWRGIKQRDNLRSLLLQILLDVETYKTQKDGLDTLVKGMSVDNPMDLAIRVNKSIDNFADKVGKDTMIATYGLLLERKKERMVTPRDTIVRFNKLVLSDEEFRQIHHFGIKGENETVERHIDYLTSIQQYQNKESNNYIVALRLKCVENLENQNFDRKNAISKCIAEYQFNKRNNGGKLL